MAVDDMLSQGQYVDDPLEGGNVGGLQYDPDGGVTIRPGGKANDEIVRAVLERMKGEPAMKGNMPSRSREGKPFYTNFAPQGNSWMWFTGGSPFPVPPGVSELDALSEVVANGLAGYRYMQEEAERKRKKEGGGQATSPAPNQAVAFNPMFPGMFNSNAIPSYTGPQPMAIPTPAQPARQPLLPEDPYANEAPLGTPIQPAPISPQALLRRRAYLDPYSILLG